MTSFLTHRLRVHDTSLPAYRRHSALRTCLTEFAPYGLPGTYHHLTVSAGIPRDLEADPDALVRAVEELHEARELWRADFERWTARRRAEKRAGRRSTRPGEPWWSHTPWRWSDPLVHPPMPLPAYVARQIALAAAARDGDEPLPGCRECGDGRRPLLRSTGHALLEVCRTCGVLLEPCPCGQHHVPSAEREAWLRVWRREHRP